MQKLLVEKTYSYLPGVPKCFGSSHPGLVDVTGAPRRTPSVRSAPTSMELLASNVHSPKEPRTRPLRRGLGPLRTLAFEGPDSKRVYTLACTAGPRQLH